MEKETLARIEGLEIRLCFLEDRLDALAQEQVALMRACERLNERLSRLERIGERARAARSGEDGN